MKELLESVAFFVLQQFAVKVIDAGMQSLSEILSNNNFSETDEKVREYLKANSDEYEYEKIDTFLADNGVYADSQASVNWHFMSVQTENIIENFYLKYPELKFHRSTLTPLLKKAIYSVYQSVISQLSSDSRILYNQAIRHDAENYI